MIDHIKIIAVAGAGAMGAGIAQVFAQAGFDVRLYDVNAVQLDKAKASISQNLQKAVAKGKLTEKAKEETASRITYTNDLHTLKADVIIEAIVEKLEVKRELFKKLAEINPDTAILASNTSSLPITQIASGISHPERVVGMHFFNPAHIMQLVEVISGAETSAAVLDLMKELTVRIGKTLVASNKRSSEICEVRPQDLGGTYCLTGRDCAAQYDRAIPELTHFLDKGKASRGTGVTTRT